MKRQLIWLIATIFCGVTMVSDYRKGAAGMVAQVQ